MIPKPYKFLTVGPFCIEVCTCPTKTVENGTKIGSVGCACCKHRLNIDHVDNYITCAKLRFRSKKTGKAVFLKH